MTRKYETGPDPVAVTVEGQTFLVNAHSARSINVEARRPGGVVVRGIPLGGSDNFVLQENGSWKPYHETTGRGGLSLTRLDREWPRSEPTPAMTKSFVALMREAASSFVTNHPGALREAEAIHAGNAILRLDKEIEETQSKLDQLVAQRGEQRNREIRALKALEAEGEAAPARGF